MKSTAIYIFLLVSLFSSVFSGCTSSSDTKTNDNNETMYLQETPSINLPNDTTHSDPPQTLIFASWEEYNALLDATTLSDAEFNAYINASNPPYYMNGICTKADVLALDAVVSTIPLPVFEECQIAQIEIHPNIDQRNISIYYQMATDIRFVYSCPLDPDPSKDPLQKLTSITVEPIISSQGKLYRAKHEDSASNQNLYYVITDNYLCYINVFHLDQEKADLLLSKITFSSLAKNRLP